MSSKSTKPNQIPDELLNHPVLQQRIAQLIPANYNFEIPKTLWRIRKDNRRNVCLQFPDGLFIFAAPIVDILREFTAPENVEFVVMADVVYGACCIDDVKAKEIGCDMIVHYGHSCLIPINRMVEDLSVLYVFVAITFDLLHFIEMVAKNFDPNKHKICLASTIQFISSAHLAARQLREKYSFDIFIPQSRPLTPGEVLGCTAPTLQPDQANVIVFIADGRFHLEALMIANPKLPAYRYDPYGKQMYREYYDYDAMIEQRKQAVHKAQQVILNSQPIGIIIGTLGRQGSKRICNVLKQLIQKTSQSPIITFFISEINPKMLEELGQDVVGCWVQIGCPRLSIDWGAAFTRKPLLSPYELRTAIHNLTMIKTQDNDQTGQNDQDRFNFIQNDQQYPMDFYSNSSLGDWTPNHKCHEKCKCVR